MPNAVSLLVGRSLGALRERRERPLSSVARRAQVSQRELRAIESGRSKASVAVLERIARALGSTLVEVVRSSKPRLTAPAPGGGAQLGLTDIARAIAELPTTDDSKVDLAISAAVVDAFEASGENQSAAARLLGMERKAFVRRLARARRRKH